MKLSDMICEPKASSRAPEFWFCYAPKPVHTPKPAPREMEPAQVPARRPSTRFEDYRAPAVLGYRSQELWTECRLAIAAELCELHAQAERAEARSEARTARGWARVWNRKEDAPKYTLVAA